MIIKFENFINGDFDNGTPLTKYFYKNSLRHEDIIGKKVNDSNGNQWYINNIDAIHDNTKLPHQIFCSKIKNSEHGRYVKTSDLFYPNDVDIVAQRVQNESYIYMSQNEIPQGIRNWVKDFSGSPVKDYRIDQSGKKVYIGMPWHERCVETYQFFNLTESGDAIPVGNEVTRKGYEGNSHQDFLEGQTKEGYIEIPEGKVLVVYCTYPRGVKIYTSVGAKLFLADTSKAGDLTDEEIIILQTTKSLKSFARPKLPIEFYDKLISKGLLAKNRSITNDGRNLLSSLGKERIEKAVDEYNKKGKGYISSMYI